MKAKNTRIIIAAVCSVGIVVMALYTRLDDAGVFANVLQSTEKTKTPPTVEAISQKLSDSWKSSLSSYNTITPTQEDNNTSTSSEPDTLTDAFAKSLFEQYIRGKTVGLYSTPEERQKFVQETVKNLNASVRDTPITRADIAVNINNEVTVVDYINAVMISLQTHSIRNEHELTIFGTALETENYELLSQLDPIAEVYQKILADLIMMPVPTSMVDKHIALSNAVQAVGGSIKGMRQLYIDPMLATVRFAMYKPASEAFNASLKALQASGMYETFPEGSAGELLMNTSL